MDTRSEDHGAFDGSPALAAESTASDAADRSQRYLLFAAAFAFFWLTASIVSDSGMRELFGADSPQYEQLANGEVLDRITRFHPVTVAISLIWVKTIGAIFPKMWPSDILTALFALIGALGVWAASSAFSLLVPKRLVPICGTIYACSLGVWYFSSIPESKIVSGTLVAIYIALYLRLRLHWTVRGAAWLTLVLFVACLNEIVSVFLVAIPAVDILLRRGIDFRAGRWIAVHALASALPALFVLEIVVGRLILPEVTDPARSSLFTMFWYYIERAEYTWYNVYNFILNWFVFSIAAPTPLPQYVDQPIAYFEPALINYFRGTASSGVIFLIAAMIVTPLLPMWRNSFRDYLPICLALIAYSFARGVFFFLYIPGESMIYTPSVILAHLIFIIVLFANSRFPAKATVLILLAVALFLTNLNFLIAS
jgi:hypothetical protein